MSGTQKSSVMVSWNIYYNQHYWTDRAHGVIAYGHHVIEESLFAFYRSVLLSYEMALCMEYRINVCWDLQARLPSLAI